MHPEDRERASSFCIAQSKAGVDHEVDYRALTKDNGFVWIRDVVHVVRNEKGEVDSLVGFMFDISERKKTEEKLERVQKELEILSYKDGLTGAFNRRMFDTVLEREWLNARQNKQSLSLILLDIDYFKQYNDHYGHVAGDKCLRSVADILERCVRRAGELVARYGGEEFVILLPGADLAHAHETAQNCLALMQQECLPHAASLAANHVTISIGVATVLPDATQDPFTLVNAADAAMYRAKSTGRAHYEVADQADWDIDPDTPRTRPGALN